jgi:hypothetical protein
VKLLGSAEPVWGTPRNPKRETLGPQVCRVAQLLGWDPMPWQRHVLDVACEIDPATGYFWYRDVRGLVPRQSGKTTIFVSKSTHRALTQPRSRIIYTAQDRNKALARLEEVFYERLLDHVAPVLDPTTAQRLKPGWMARMGAERIKFVTKSLILIDANTKKSGHGDTLDEWHADEVFAHQDGQVAQNIRPTMITRDHAQIWHLSAAGDTVTSPYWHELVLDGRAIVESGVESRIAFFEWSEKDLAADRADTSRWPTIMPALGYTISIDTMRSELEAWRTRLDEFDRAYRGIWTGVNKVDPIIPVIAWNDDAWTSEHDPIDWDDHPPVWSLDIAPDQEWSSIGVAGRPADDSDRRVTVRLVDHELGTAWVIERLRQLRATHGGDTVAIAGASAAMGFQKDLEDKGFEVVVLPRAEVAAACAGFFADAVNRLLWHVNDDDLNEALAGAVKHAWGDAWVWWRGRSMKDVSPCYAVTIARHVFLKLAPARGYDPVTDVR